MAPPSWFRRQLWRAGRSLTALSGLIGNPPYSGAQGNRLTLDWIRASLSPDKEAEASLAVLRTRSRDLQKNNAHAAQYIRLMTDNVIGPRGITLQSKLMTRKKNFDEVTNAAVEQAWADWGRPENCSVNGRLSWLDIQRLTIALLHGDGEVFIRKRRGLGAYAFQLELIDPDLLEESFSRRASRGTNEIRMSIEIDGDGKRIAYHVLKRHPDDLVGSGGVGERRVRVPAEEMLHLYVAARPGQTRGVPGLAPVLFALRMHNGYQEAEVVAARAAATKLGIIQQSGDGYVSTEQENPDGQPMTVDAEPGSFWKLAPGETLASFDPRHPTTAFRDFSKGILQMVSAGVGVSYASLTGDLEGTSFASGRTGLLQERDRYKALQAWCCEHLHIPVFNEWLDYASLSMLRGVPMDRLEALRSQVTWVGRGFAWVDPQADSQATALQLQNGLTSRTRVLAEQGQDVEDVFDELARERELADEKGIKLADAAPPPAPAPAQDANAGDGKTNNQAAADDGMDEGRSRVADVKILSLIDALAARQAPEAIVAIDFEHDPEGRVVGAVAHRGETDPGDAFQFVTNDQGRIVRALLRSNGTHREVAP